MEKKIRIPSLCITFIYLIKDATYVVGVDEETSITLAPSHP